MSALSERQKACPKQLETRPASLQPLSLPNSPEHKEFDYTREFPGSLSSESFDLQRCRRLGPSRGAIPGRIS